MESSSLLLCRICNNITLGFSNMRMPIHTLRSIPGTFNVNVLQWPARSLDLSPIEHLWDHLGCQVRERMSTTSVILNVPCKLNGSGSHCRSLENWFAAWDVVVWQSWLLMVGTPKNYGITLMHVIGDKNQITEDVSDFMISYLPFPQKSIRSELAKLFSISIR